MRSNRGFNVSISEHFFSPSLTGASWSRVCHRASTGDARHARRSFAQGSLDLRSQCRSRGSSSSNKIKKFCYEKSITNKHNINSSSFQNGVLRLNIDEDEEGWGKNYPCWRVERGFPPFEKEAKQTTTSCRIRSRHESERCSVRRFLGGGSTSEGARGRGLRRM